MDTEDFWLPDVPSDFVLKFPGSDESWKLGPILKEKLLEGDEYDGVEISEASGVCIAEQIDGPRKGMKAIAKVRTQ
ncbi:hypothetical protein Plec18167_002050 [Paecilomyces lecythidis]|uniref:Uncharacterized protein n=1 Tax=Paecilomyces lecythidis TaxID=3004212 RepID=A0ABR3Y853_9EURO